MGDTASSCWSVLAAVAALLAVPATGMAQQSESESGSAPAKVQSSGEAGEAASGDESAADRKLLAASLKTIQPAVTGQMAAKERKLKRIRKKLEQEPGIDEVQDAALEFYGVGGRKIQKYSNQASTKNWAPKVSLQYRRNYLGTDVDKFDYKVYQNRPVGLDTIDGQVDEFAASGTWNLPKLIYNPEKLELASLRKLRERVLKEVTRLYYLRRRLKISFMLEPPKDVSSRVRKRIRIKQTTAMINAMTGGIYETGGGE